MGRVFFFSPESKLMNRFFFSSHKHLENSHTKKQQQLQWYMVGVSPSMAASSTDTLSPKSNNIPTHSERAKAQRGSGKSRRSTILGLSFHPTRPSI